MTKEEAMVALNKFRCAHYNDGLDDDKRELALTLDVILPTYRKLEKLVKLYRKADKIRKEMYESVDQGRIETLMKILILNQEEIDKLEAELDVF